ncbi:hypothetical protein GCM10007096_07960 [Pullulanibacillus pueri]|uniref:Uncharacterized protein n=1 Tax=Pullulanibacillus pueri TaxID=1437324 RepID=A0A8J2ZU96_9BACL|nr:hypothetical protein GCM10007096_07960 [Pullulanibacillus pueri]
MEASSYHNAKEERCLVCSSFLSNGFRPLNRVTLIFNNDLISFNEIELQLKTVLSRQSS